MELSSFTEYEATRQKLKRIEELYEEQSSAPAENPHARALSLRSLRMVIKQLSEEILRFEARAGKRSPVADQPGRTEPVRPIGAG